MWLSRNNFTSSDFLQASDMNNLANDIRNWGGDVNGGGCTLNNVKLGATGGFQYYASPMEIVAGGDGTSRTQYDQTLGTAPSQTQSPRWTAGKDATAETGSNAGSNYSIARYSDAGVLIDTPFSINRASGLITLGSQQWSGPVNGGGQQLSNVTITGYATDPTINQGDMIARGSSSLVNVPRPATNGYVLTYNTASNSVAWSAPAGGVSPTRMINTTAPMTGGGSLAADLTLAVNVFGPSGASHSSGLVPDPGTPAGATRYLREDGSWNVPAGGTGGGSPGGNSGDVQFNSSGAFGGSSYLFWDNANLRLGIGTTTPNAGLEVQTAMNPTARLKGSPAGNNTQMRFWGAAAAADLWSIGTDIVAANGSKDFHFYNISVGAATVTIQQSTGNVGIGTSSPTYTLTVNGSTSGTPFQVSTSTPGLARSVFINQDTTINSRMDVQIGTANGPYSVILGVDPASAYGRGEKGYLDASGVPFFIQAAMLMLNPGGNSVGIGTTNPIRILQVVGASTASTANSAMMSGYQAAFEVMNAAQNQNYYFGVNDADANKLYIGAGRSPGQGIAPALTVIGTGGSGVSTTYNVGIGTTSPQHPLHVTGPGSAPQFQIGVDGNPLYGLQFSYNNPNGVIQALNNNAGSILMLNPNGGNVGLGVTNPRGGLTIVAGTPATAATARQLTIGEATNNPAFDVALGYANISGTGWCGVLQALQGSTGTPLLLNPAGGLVGIGTSAPPNYSLHVQGDCNITGAYRVNGVAIGGGITTQTAPSRALNTVYQNSTGKPMFVSVSATPSAGTGLTAKTDGGNPPGTTVALGGVGSYTTQIVFWVLPGNYYEVLASSAALNQWTEYY